MEFPGGEKGKFCLAEGRHISPGGLMTRRLPMLDNLQLRVQGTGCFDSLQNGN